MGSALPALIDGHRVRFSQIIGFILIIRHPNYLSYGRRIIALFAIRPDALRRGELCGGVTSFQE